MLTSKKLFNNTKKQYTSDEACLKHILENQVFGLSPTPILQGITQAYIFGFDTENNISRKNFIQHDITLEAQEGNAKEKLQELFNLKKDMKFDAVVGNPPYQESDGGAQASAKPIYNYFVESAKQINTRLINLIMPTRWYAGGKGLDDFRKQMLNDEHIVEIHDFLNPNIIFPSTNIRGGVCFILWDNDYSNEKDLVKVVTYGDSFTDRKELKRKLKLDGEDIFIRNIESLEIIKIIKSHKEFTSFENYISSRRPFDIDAFIVKDLDKYKQNENGLKNPVICYGKGKQTGFLEKEEITKNIEWIDKYKVFTPRANNIGTELNDDNLNTFIGKPNTICTESYIVVGVTLSLDEHSAKNLSQYLTTKFARFLHSLGKASQDATSKTYKFIPLQDFTSNSEIDWSKSISEIDQQLYKKYGLSEDEISFIERMIKPMA